MERNTKWIIGGLVLVIIVLSALLLHSMSQNTSTPSPNQPLRLLSGRVYAGLLTPKSFLILNYAPLRNELESYITAEHLNVSVYLVNLRDGASIGINERKGYSPASLNKVPVAILIMKKIEDGDLTLDTPVPIPNELRTDTFGTLYKINAKELPVHVLLEHMLKESDNTAFLILSKLADQKDAQLILSYFDYYSDDSVDNTKPGQETENGLVTPKSMYNVFSSLFLSTILTPEHSEYILRILTNTTFDIKKIAQLPDNVTVSQKFGEKYVNGEKNFHSCGIIYAHQMRLFYCIMTKDMKEEDAIKTIGGMTHAIYEYAIETRSILDELSQN